MAALRLVAAEVTRLWLFHGWERGCARGEKEPEPPYVGCYGVRVSGRGGAGTAALRLVAAADSRL